MKQEKQLDDKTNWFEILTLIKKNTFSQIYKDYFVNKKEEGYYIHDKEAKVIFLFKQETTVKIYLNSNKYETIKILSSLDIENYIKKKKKHITNLFFKEMGNMNIKYLDKIKNLGNYINYNLEIREKKQLKELKLDEPLSKNQNYSPIKYSEFYYEYFIYDDVKEKDNKIIYEDNAIRSKIHYNILELRERDELKTFKFTGPSSIGKSFTLLRISRICYNIAYINLKVLSNESKTLYDIYSMIMSELKRFDVANNLSELNDKIKNCYDDNISLLDLLINIMEFLNQKDLECVFILDQFKPEYINNNFLEKIKNFNKIKIVKCSSINDKNIRKECLNGWMYYGRNFIDLKKENQQYYFYFSKIYNYKFKNKENHENIFRQFSYIPKYIKKYKKAKNKDKTKFFEENKKNIERKIDEFCENNQIEKSLLLSKLKYIIGKEFDYDVFRIIIQYCPLKYYIVYFKKNTFLIKPMFPFMQNIINYKLKEIECDNYFIKEKYKNDLIANEYVKGDYFEAAAKFGLQKLKLPGINKKFKKFRIITLNEIVSMDKIINEDDFIEDLKDDDLAEENEYEPLILDNNKAENYNNKFNNNMQNENDQLSIDIDENNNVGNSNYKQIEGEREEIDEEKEEEEEEEQEKEVEEGETEEEDEEKEEEIEGEEEKGDELEAQNEIDDEKSIENIENYDKKNEKNNKGNNFVNKALKTLLNTFQIKEERKRFKEEGLSKEVISFSKNIEDYRNDEIEIQKKQCKNFEKSNFIGSRPIFFEQYSKWGKALDFAYLYGNKYNKKFIGFQTKCYFENSELNSNAVDKCWIRKQCQKILVNSMKLFNCKITKWFYFLIFYVNNKNKNENINEKNLEKCKKNDISYLFYDPAKKKFYNKRKKEINILKVTNKANLDSFVINEEKFYNLNRMGKIKIGRNILEMKEAFIKDFYKVFDITNKEINITNILSMIAEKLNIKDYELWFHAKCYFNKLFFCPPNKKFVLLYKNKDKINFIASLTKKGKIEYIDISTGKEVANIFEVLDSTSDYYYCLLKIRRSKKRFFGDYSMKLKDNGKIANIRDIP